MIQISRFSISQFVSFTFAYNFDMFSKIKFVFNRKK